MPNPAETLTLEDLKNWNRCDQAGNFLPSLAVLGHPVAHSVSPQMHNAALNYLRRTNPTLAEKLQDWQYFKFEIKAEELEEALKLLAQKNFKGVNLTLPHKVEAVRFVQEVAPDAKMIGAVNTLFRNSTGAWNGDNTDTYGLAQALKLELDVDLKGSSVVLLGAGGAARAAAAQCLEAGCAMLWIGNRDEGRRQALIKHLNKPDRVKGFFLDAPPSIEWPENVVVINATTAGLNSDDQEPINIKNHLGSNARIFDMTFQRGDTTRLVTAARNRSLRAADGLGMLIWQGAKSLSRWLRGENGIDINPEDIAQIMMDSACKALGLPPRHA